MSHFLDMWKSLVSRDNRYAELTPVVLEAEKNIGTVGKEKTIPLCKNLGRPVIALRRLCLLGHSNPDGLGGVKPCCDCGPHNCDDYLEDPDSI